ncbi:MAG: DUF2185 domain-containing protein [Pseudomonadota bacterium]
MSQPSYALVDPRPIAASAPYTFFLPSHAELAGVRSGDVVKLMFEYAQETQKWAVERMWVIVHVADGETLKGELNNDPDEPTSPLQAGNQVIFQRHHIVSIEAPDSGTATLPIAQREYWERCLVDECVLEGSEPVEVLYREKPDMQQDGDRYPDSGWRIRGRMQNATDEEIDNRKAAYVSVGAVLNKDDSWLPFLDAAIGTRLMRDFTADIYVQEK